MGLRFAASLARSTQLIDDNKFASFVDQQEAAAFVPVMPTD